MPEPLIDLKSVLDLGVCEGPLLFFGGPYSNLQALTELQAFCNQQGFTPDRVICTGDVVAYCGDPEPCVTRLRDWGIQVVMGNCEESLATAAEDCGCGFGEGSACDLLSDDWYSFASRRVSPQSREWMAALPRRIEFELGGRRFAVIHGAADEINRFVFRSSSLDDKAEQIRSLGVSGIIGGHCGLPFGQHTGSGVWFNAGTIGMPANDGQSSTWFMTLQVRDSQIRKTATNENSRALQARWHRLEYDAPAAAASMKTRQLKTPYADALLSGLWPSMDVLPDAEREHQGRAIELADMLF